MIGIVTKDAFIQKRLAEYLSHHEGIICRQEPDAVITGITAADVLVIDARADHYDALDVCRRVCALPRQYRPALVLLVDGDDNALMREAFRIGVDECLPLQQDANALLKAIRRVRLRHEQASFREQLAEDEALGLALNDTAAVVHRSLDLDQVLDAIINVAGRVVSYRALNLMQVEDGRLRVVRSFGYTPDEQAWLAQLDLAVDQLPPVDQATPHHIQNDRCPDDEQAEANDLLPWVRSHVSVPLAVYHQWFGVLNIDSDEPDAFTERQLIGLQLFTEQATMALENARVHETVYHFALDMQSLQRSSEALFSLSKLRPPDVRTFCEEVAAVVLREFRTVDCGVILYDRTSGKIERMARTGKLSASINRPMQLEGDGLVPEALRTGRTQYAADVRHHPPDATGDPTTRSELVVPLRGRDRVIGVLDFQSTVVNAFNDVDLRQLELFADRVTIAIENLQLQRSLSDANAELERRVQERTEQFNRVKERVEAILNHNSDAIILINPNERIQQTNYAFNAMFGFLPDEVFNDHFTIIAADAESRMLLRAVFDDAISRRRASRAEITVESHGHIRIEADVQLSPVLDAQGAVTSVICSLRDITERKRLEQHLRTSLDKERELNELKTRFISRTSHEFRTPLSIIITSSELLKNYSERMTPEQRAEKLSRVQREARTIADMLDDILMIQKHVEQKPYFPERVDVRTIMQGMVDTLRETHQDRYQFAEFYTGEAKQVFVDPKLVEQVIRNLLSNAVKYSPEGGTIFTEVRQDQDETVLVIRDQGIGIPSDDQSHLFEPFYRASNVEHISGTGLGLAIVKQAVDLHGGSITCESEVGQGTAFIVRFPNQEVRDEAHISH